jgi:coenzyme Q-binding protein COQ10
MPQAQRSIEIGVSPDRLFEVVEDFPRYPEFIPDLRRVRVLRKGEASQDVEFELELALPLGMKKRIRYSLAFNEERPKSVKWRLISGEYLKGNVGSWTFRSLGENRTEATYNIELSFGPLVPKAISNFLAEQSLPRLLAQFKARAESLPRQPQNPES